MTLARKKFGSVESSCMDSDQHSTDLRRRAWMGGDVLQAYSKIRAIPGVQARLPDGGMGALGQTRISDGIKLG